MPLPLQSGAGERLFPSPKLTFQDRLSWDSKLITNRRDCDLYQQRWINWAGISSSHLPPNFLSRCLLSRPLIPASAVCTSVSRKASMVKCTELTLYRLGEKEMLKLRCLSGGLKELSSLRWEVQPSVGKVSSISTEAWVLYFRLTLGHLWGTSATPHQDTRLLCWLLFFLLIPVCSVPFSQLRSLTVYSPSFL